MKPARILGMALAAALAAGSARAQEEKAQAKASPPPNPIETLIGLDANSDMVIDREEVPESGRAAFDRLLDRGDANDNGKLEVEELRALLGRLRQAGNPAAAAERFRAMDKDGDGKVSREEFRGPEPLFDRLDADQDGAITSDEARAARRPGAPQPRPEPGRVPAERERRLRAMDQDGDKKISREEFRGPEGIFDRLDANQDGFVTEPEMERLRPGGAPTANQPPGAGRPRRLARMDKDGDGKITREEFPGPGRLFDRLDADRDGTISREELRKAAPQRGESPADEPSPGE